MKPPPIVARPITSSARGRLTRCARNEKPIRVPTFTIATETPTTINARALGSPGIRPEALEKAALAELRARHPERVLETNVEFWAAIVLDFAQVPAHIFPSMFTAARTAGWSAHILEQKKTGRLIRPSARYIGPGPRKPQEVHGWDESVHALHN